MKRTRRLNIHNCSRCGSTHLDITAKKFDRPIEDTDGTIWDWWATCPTTGDPIIARNLESEEESEH